MADPFRHRNVGISAPMRTENETMICIAYLDGENGGSSWKYSANGLIYTNCHETWIKQGWYAQVKRHNNNFAYMEQSQ